MVREGIALWTVLTLLLSPGAVGLARAFASLDTCGCNMGLNCPMCRARRAKERREARCPCRLQRGHAGDGHASTGTPDPDPVCTAGLAGPLTSGPSKVAGFAAPFPVGWMPDVPHPPPRA